LHPARKDIDRANDIGVIFVTAIDTQEFRLCLAIFFRYVAAAWTRLACVVRRNGKQYATVPYNRVGV
jgi:hypothetical protein